MRNPEKLEKTSGSGRVPVFPGFRLISGRSGAAR
jgi:hypothetical protein